MYADLKRGVVMIARIMLEDGTLLEGKSFGSQGTVYGEVVFNTGMTGYQEILTDPSYAGQIVTMTYPLIGNYGINAKDMESTSIKVSGFIVKEYSTHPSHWQMQTDLAGYLAENNIMGVYDIDTRMLTKRIRNHGAMKSVITTDASLSLLQLQEGIKAYTFPGDIVKKVSTPSVIQYMPTKGNGKMHLGVIDLGIKQGIVQQLLDHQCKVTVFPSDISIENIEVNMFDAILFSNGPGDPKECVEAIALAKDLKGQMPLFGICLGHQILALSLGGDTYKLKFGHRGSNHPVLDLRTQKVYMTAQNHGYAVDRNTIPSDLQLTHINVNDDTVEGIISEKWSVESVQFHPEEGPGPTDATVIFKEWLDKIERKKADAIR